MHRPTPLTLPTSFILRRVSLQVSIYDAFCHMNHSKSGFLSLGELMAGLKWLQLDLESEKQSHLNVIDFLDTADQVRTPDAATHGHGCTPNFHSCLHFRAVEGARGLSPQMLAALHEGEEKQYGTCSMWRVAAVRSSGDGAPVLNASPCCIEVELCGYMVSKAQCPSFPSNLSCSLPPSNPLTHPGQRGTPFFKTSNYFGGAGSTFQSPLEAGREGAGTCNWCAWWMWLLVRAVSF